MKLALLVGFAPVTLAAALSPALPLPSRSTAAAPADRCAPWVEQRVQAWQPTARERRWEAIGWAKDLRDAQRLARATRRPVFLFTHDGRLSVGRC
jgi:hypothetical protein